MQQLATRFKLETDHKNGACAVSNTLRTGYGKNQVFIFRLKICYKKSHTKKQNTTGSTICFTVLNPYFNPN